LTLTEKKSENVKAKSGRYQQEVEEESKEDIEDDQLNSLTETNTETVPNIKVITPF
jgi:hypothetical protein